MNHEPDASRDAAADEPSAVAGGRPPAGGGGEPAAHGEPATHGEAQAHGEAPTGRGGEPAAHREAPTHGAAGPQHPPSSTDEPPADSSAEPSRAASHRAGVLARLRALVREHPVASAASAGALALILLGPAALAAGAAVRPAPVERAAAATPPPPAPTAAPARPAPAAAPASVALRTCSVADRAADGRLAELQAQVVNAATGEVLYDRGGTTPSRTASVLKVLTSAAALSVLGPDYRATTTVVKGAEPGSVVLVGGGDVTLSRTPSGDEGVYPGAAHLDDLAAQVRAAWEADPSNPPLTKLVLDASYFGGDEWQPSWLLKERDDGYQANVAALMVDGDRDDPYSNTSTRSADPVGRAGQAFADELGGIQAIERGTAPAGAAQLGAVSSPTVAQLIDKALVVSDNTAAEMLARLVAIETGSGNTFGAIQAGVLQGLAAYGLDTSGIVIADGSGLSDDNAVPPSYLTRLFVKIHAREGALGVIMDALPIAGQRGSLSYADRFSGDNAVADGAVFAKTGWIDTGYTLAGVINAQDGTALTFAIYALGDVSDDTKQAIDTLATGFYLCGDGLSNR